MAVWYSALQGRERRGEKRETISQFTSSEAKCIPQVKNRGEEEVKWHNAIVKSHKFPATTLTFVHSHHIKCHRMTERDVDEWVGVEFFNSIHSSAKSDHPFNLIIFISAHSLTMNCIHSRGHCCAGVSRPESIRVGGRWLNDLIAITIIIRAASQLMELEKFRH